MRCVIWQVSSWGTRTWAEYEAKAAKAQANGDSKKAADLLEAAVARRMWLSEAQKGLADFQS